MKLFRTAIQAAVAFTLISTAALASALQVKTQAPGFYRMMVGSYEVTVLLDGFFPMNPKEFFSGLSDAQLHKYLSESYQSEVIPTSDNAFLINTGTRLILVDSGCGAFFGPSYGHVLENLKAAGYTPDQVDEVEITHMHTDHVGGIMLNGKAVFPHATVRVDQRDADYWLNLNNANQITDPIMKGMFANAIAAVAPYQALNQFKPFQGETELAPGVKAIPSYGHTPGHTMVSVESQGAKLLLVGDLFHVEAIEFADPSVHFRGDAKQAVTQRKKVFKEAAEKGFEIGAAHLPFPGIGHVLKAKAAYRYLPIPYGPVK